MTYREAVKIMRIVKKYWYPKLMCSEACKKFLQIMYIFEVEGRYVALKRPSTNLITNPKSPWPEEQGHSVCEIKLNDKWVYFDVAFNFATGNSVEEFSKDGHNLLVGHQLYTEKYVDPKYGDTRYEELMELYQNYSYGDFVFSDPIIINNEPNGQE